MSECEQANDWNEKAIRNSFCLNRNWIASTNFVLCRLVWQARDRQIIRTHNFPYTSRFFVRIRASCAFQIWLLCAKCSTWSIFHRGPFYFGNFSPLRLSKITESLNHTVQYSPFGCSFWRRASIIRITEHYVSRRFLFHFLTWPVSGEVNVIFGSVKEEL